jgi:endonuclease/exonuclease/phosphatase family metal-dependent hydrolase
MRRTFLRIGSGQMKYLPHGGAMNYTGWKRITALMLILLLALPMLFACDSAPKGPTGGETTAAPSAEETTTGGAGETEPEGTEPEETEADPDMLSIPASELANYRIIYPQAVTEAEQMQILYLQMAIEERFGISLEMRDDFVRPGTDLVESEYEILVGRCARAASRAVYSTMRTKDYGYCMVDKKLVITGGSAEATVEAVKAFLESGIGDGTGDLFRNEARASVDGVYTVGAVMLNGAEIGAYTIVYPKGNADLKSAASYLALKIETELEYRLDTQDDSAEVSGRKILLGAVAGELPSLKDYALTENDYLIMTVGESVWLTGNTVTMVYRATDGLLERFTGDAAAGADVLLNVTEPIKVTLESSSLRAMSFNVRCAEFTEERIALAIQMINTYAPDTFGVQEATVDWMNVLKKRLGDRYDCVGVGRDSNLKGEFSAVFYLKSKFELIEGGTKWMSDTPDVAGSKIPESSLPRIFSYAELKVKATGQTFVHVNTHLEHTSEEARELQAKVLAEFLERYRSSGVAYIVSGDFNCERGAGSYNVMINSGLRDSLYIAEKAEQGATYHGYGKTSKVIDHIFVPGCIEVRFYRACTETFKYADGSTAYPSDHNPVIIDFVIR